MNPAPPCNGVWQDIESRRWDEMTPVERERTYENEAQPSDSPSTIPIKDILKVIELADEAAQGWRAQPWYRDAVEHIKRKCGL